MRLRHLHAQRAGGVGGFGDLPDVDKRPERVGVLHDETGRALGGRRELRRRHLDDLETWPAPVRAQRAPVREVDVARDDDLVASGDANRHERRLGRGRAAVVHRRVHDIHREELGHERLVLVDRLQCALADLGLVRRVRGEELAAQREHRHGCGDVATLDRAADEERPVARARVHLGEPLEVRLDLYLGETRSDAELRVTRVLGDRAEKLVDVAHADAFEHRGPIGIGVRRVGVIPHGQSPPAPAVSPMCAR